MVKEEEEKKFVAVPTHRLLYIYKIMTMSDPKTAYLVLYNYLCFSGWLYVLLVSLLSILHSLSDESSTLSIALSSIYASSGMRNYFDLPLCDALLYVQCAAVLEIVHSAVGLVRSPVVVTTLQVGSRMAALFAIYNSPESQGTLLCVVSVARAHSLFTPGVGGAERGGVQSGRFPQKKKIGG